MFCSNIPCRCFWFVENNSFAFRWLGMYCEQQSRAPLRLWSSSAEVARTLGINKGNLSKCISGKYRSSGGFGWRNASPNDLSTLARIPPSSQPASCYSTSSQATPAHVTSKLHREGYVFIPTKAEPARAPKGAAAASANRPPLKRRRAAKVFGS